MNKEQNFSHIINITLKGIAIAMGVAVFVTNIFGVADPSAQLTMLAIGLFCLALNALDQE